ncbi:MAG: transcription elongation factor GreA [Sandaracinaceae bacterium]
MDKVPMTPEGHAALLAEVTHLKNVERPKISKEIGVAREHGDLRENAEYHAAKEKQGMIEARIAEIEDKIARADVIDPSTFSGDKVKFGAYVTLEDTDSGKRVRYRIVGPDEADLKKGTISVTSPIARALIGRRVGDEVTVNAPGGERVYEISEVAWTP